MPNNKKNAMAFIQLFLLQIPVIKASLQNHSFLKLLVLELRLIINGGSY
jgi:hypothetical protein